MSNTRKPRLREALKKRTTKKTFYDIPQVEHEVAQKAAEDLVLAKNTVRAAQFLQAREGKRDDIVEALAAAQREVEAAQQRVDDCFFRVWFVGMREDNFDALVNAHPPTDEQREQARKAGEEEPIWNEDVLPFELLEHCAQESDLTAEQWREEIEGWTRAEKAEILSRVLDCNVRSFRASLSFD